MPTATWNGTKVRGLGRLPILAGVLLFAGTAHAACPEIPGDVSWWNDLSHDRVVETVDRTYDGDWDLFITETYKLVYDANEAYKRGDVVRVPGAGVTLRGEPLGRYVSRLARMLSVVRCVAREARNGAEADALDTFMTAAGALGSPAIRGASGRRTFSDPLAGTDAGEPRANPVRVVSQRADQTARRPEARLTLHTTSSCLSGDARFRITNRGPRWPAPGKVLVYRVKDRRLIAQRLIRFAEGQMATFKVRNAGASEVAIWVQPSWYSRGFEYDAKIQCS